MEWFEIRSDTEYRAPFSLSFRMVILGFSVLNSVLINVAIMAFFEALGWSIALSLIASSMGILLCLIGIRLVQQRLMFGAVQVNWQGVIFNGMFRQRDIALADIQSVDGAAIHLHNSTRISLPRGITRLVRGKLTSEITERCSQRKDIERVKLPCIRSPFSLANLTLRPWRMADQDPFFRLFSSPTFRRANEVSYMSRSRARRYVSAFEKLNNPRFQHVRHWAIEDPTSSSPSSLIGHLDIWVTTFKPATLSIAYGLSETRQGQGTMTALLSALVGEATDVWGIERVEARCRAHNRASRRVLEKSGFEMAPWDASSGDPETIKYVFTASLSSV